SIPEEWWLQGAGLSTEIAAGQGKFLFGANYDPQEDGNINNDSGYLYAYGLSGGPNLKLIHPQINPPSPEEKGIPATITVTAVNESNEAIDTKIAAYWLKTPGNIIEVPVHLKPLESKPVNISVQYPHSDDTILMFINPYLNAPKG